MKTFYLHGYAARFGSSFELDVDSPAEGLKALFVMLPGFREMFVDGAWHVLRGPLENRDDDDVESLDLSLGDITEFHLVPAVKGAGNGGGLSVVLGVIAIVVSTVLTGGLATAFLAAGIGMVVGGIIQMTMKIPGVDTNTESTDNKASFLFSGPKNQSTQGVAIPRGYGRCRVGSVVISAGLYAEAV